MYLHYKVFHCVSSQPRTRLPCSLLPTTQWIYRLELTHKEEFEIGYKTHAGPRQLSRCCKWTPQQQKLSTHSTTCQQLSNCPRAGQAVWGQNGKKLPSPLRRIGTTITTALGSTRFSLHSYINQEAILLHPVDLIVTWCWKDSLWK